MNQLRLLYIDNLTKIVKKPKSTIPNINPITRNLLSISRSQFPRAPLFFSTRRRQFSLRLTSRHLKMDAISPENLSGSVVDDFVNVRNPDDESDNPNFVHFDRENDVGDDSGASNSVLESVNLDEVMKNVVVLTYENVDGESDNPNFCSVYLVGTAHVSEESCREVQAIISFLKPQVVFLELCSSRVSILTLKDLKVPTFSEMVDLWKKKHNVFGIVYSWFLAKVALKLNVFPGSEFRVAFEEAMKCGSKVILGDRPVNITLSRTWRKMPLWHKTKFIYSLLFQGVFLPDPEELEKMLKEVNDVDMLTLVIQETSKQFPTLMETLVNERDQYMSSALLQIAKEHTSVVAIVGKGHLQGIRRNWNQPIEVSELLEIPSLRPALSVVKLLSTFGVAVAGAAIVYGVFLASKKQS